MIFRVSMHALHNLNEGVGPELVAWQVPDGRLVGSGPDSRRRQTLEEQARRWAESEDPQDILEMLVALHQQSVTLLVKVSRAPVPVTETE